VTVVQDERRRRLRELHERVNRLAAGLSELGLGRGDVIGLLLYNSPSSWRWSRGQPDRRGIPAAELPLSEEECSTSWATPGEGCRY